MFQAVHAKALYERSCACAIALVFVVNHPSATTSQCTNAR